MGLNRVRIYLAIEEVEEGLVAFRRWSPDMPGIPFGGEYAQQSIDAHLWIQRMVYRCARDIIKPVVNWETPLPVTDAFLRKVPPFEVLDAPETEETQFVEGLRQNGFEDARFVH